jgi:hypothetical protein
VIGEPCAVMPLGTNLGVDQSGGAGQYRCCGAQRKITHRLNSYELYPTNRGLHSDPIEGKGSPMENRASLSLAVGLAGLLLGLAAAAQAQYFVIGDDNKLHWDDAGKA